MARKSYRAVSVPATSSPYCVQTPGFAMSAEGWMCIPSPAPLLNVGPHDSGAKIRLL